MIRGFNPTCRYVLKYVLLVAMVVMLTGCVYGDRIRQQGAPPPGDNLVLVQNAMELYIQKTGLLPIRNKDAETPELERYMIDFKKLQQAQILAAIPNDAYENGGSALYVVVRTLSEPQVKLLDLVSYQQLAQLQQAVDSYKLANQGELPLGEQVAEGYWQPDYSKLKRKEELLRSPYTPQKLYPILNESGVVGIDYAPEMLKLVQKLGISPDPKLDLRELLLDHYPYVPARSFPYYWSGTAPVLSQ